MDKLMLSKTEAGRMLGLSPSTIDRLISAGRIAIRRFGRRVLICRSEIERLTGPGTPQEKPSQNAEDSSQQPFSKPPEEMLMDTAGRNFNADEKHNFFDAYQEEDVPKSAVDNASGV